MCSVPLKTRAAILALAVAALTASHTPVAQSSVITPWLETALRQARTSERQLVWIYFRDKGPRVSERIVAEGALTPSRVRQRRVFRGRMTASSSLEDVALDRGYVAEVARRVSRVRHESRWLNAVSAEATPAQIQALAGLPFVTKIDTLRRYRRTRSERIEPDITRTVQPAGVLDQAAAFLDYGAGFDQVGQIKIPELHERGLDGTGVTIAVFDTGFPNLGHEAFATMRIVAERDFVNGLDSVRASTDAHGTATLSVLGGFRPGQLIGPAYAATFILAITEDSRSETPIEEDNWAVAAEWAEAMGADVISSSLGYLAFDFPHTSYTDRDMDGQTAVTTRAASMAAARGVVVVNSTGNGGYDPSYNTLGAPADGRDVIAVGAVDRDGIRAPFSSVGPTTDGRVKPDVVALGVRARVASTASTTAYGRASGTSFSCPLTAGAVALVLQAHPTYRVSQVIDAIRSTASQAAAPDNLLGWGVIDALQAVDRAPLLDSTSSSRPSDRAPSSQRSYPAVSALLTIASSVCLADCPRGRSRVREGLAPPSCQTCAAHPGLWKTQRTRFPRGPWTAHRTRRVPS